MTISDDIYHWRNVSCCIWLLACWFLVCYCCFGRLVPQFISFHFREAPCPAFSLHSNWGKWRGQEESWALQRAACLPSPPIPSILCPVIRIYDGKSRLCSRSNVWSLSFMYVAKSATCLGSFYDSERGSCIHMLSTNKFVKHRFQLVEGRSGLDMDLGRVPSSRVSVWNWPSTWSLCHLCCMSNARDT